MLVVSNKFLSQLLNNISRSLVGRLCRQIENVQEGLDPNSQEYKYLEIVKKLHKDKVYETFRDLKTSILSYDSGIKSYKKYDVIRPSEQYDE